MHTSFLPWNGQGLAACLTLALPVFASCVAVYLFLRWVYARAGITTKADSSSSAQYYQPVGLATKQGVIAFVHTDADDSANGRDTYLTESRLELADWQSHSGGGSSRSHSGAGVSSGGGFRDAHSRGLHDV
jgi:uncharacterized membrane protein YgcG